MIVKMTIDLARGFEPWKQMFIKNHYSIGILKVKSSVSSIQVCI